MKWDDACAVLSTVLDLQHGPKVWKLFFFVFPSRMTSPFQDDKPHLWGLGAKRWVRARLAPRSNHTNNHKSSGRCKGRDVSYCLIIPVCGEREGEECSRNICKRF